MKCQHCGINFEDGERFCPICGESDIWLCIYRSRTDGSIILQDMDQIGLFGDTDIYELNPTALI